MDNDTHFNNDHLITWCNVRGTTFKFASITHPKTNGQLEAVNKLIKGLLRKKLDDAKGFWPEKLEEVLWAIHKNLLEEKRIAAHHQNILNKQCMEHFYNSRVKSRTLQLGDRVLKKVQTKVTGLRPRWDKPYKVIEIIAPNTHSLEDKYGERLAHPWNMEQLKYYYK
ncbi:uncharacterized protein LOC126790704 [Argentina anserina]|uniref:uncharacterized protein LOC126790704 n=1 Tax=Argentina anserina TaxID=57926 RepID=UPI0021765EE6|nr:uncharacterized protein LOC126790704 [Potentilla anserina]